MTSTFSNFMIKPFFMSISVASIAEVFTARFLPVSEHLVFIDWGHHKFYQKFLFTILKHQNNI